MDYSQRRKFMNITDEIKDVLLNLKVDDNAKTVTITQQLERKTYQAVNELLETSGGKWNRKAKAHVFTVSPSDALKVFFTGDDVTKTVTTTVETAKELKKTYQAFFTPDKLADELVNVAEYHFPYGGPKVTLEPSAGNGQLVRALQRKWPNLCVNVCEIQTQYHDELKSLGCNIVGTDFLKVNFNGTVYGKVGFDLILANPPFASHADQKHLRHMYELLASDGVLISITSNHWRHASHKVDKEFCQWIEDVDAEVYDIDSGAFKESGTLVSANYVVIHKE